MPAPAALLATLALAAPAPQESPPPTPARERVTTTGTVRVLDREGRWREGLDGAFELWWRGDGHVIAAVDGTWSVDLLQGGSYEISEGWSVAPPGEARTLPWTVWSPTRIQAGGFHVLSARAQQEPCLRVFDVRTGEELDEVTVILDASVPGSVYPRWSDVHSPWWGVEDSPSPVGLDYDPLWSDFDTKTYWVRAPGFAWQRVRVDVSRPGEMLVGLQPAGSIEVERRDRLSSGATIRRLVAGSARVPCARKRRRTIEDLPIGEHLVELPVPDLEGRELGVAFGARRATVEAGSTARVVFEERELDPTAPSGALVVRFTPSLEAGEADGRPRALLLAADPTLGPLARVEPLESGEADGTTWTWPALPAGEYVVRVVEREQAPGVFGRVHYARARVDANRTREVVAQVPRQPFTVRATEAASGGAVRDMADSGGRVTRWMFALDGEEARDGPLDWTLRYEWDLPPGVIKAWLMPGRRYRVAHSGYLHQWIHVPANADEEIHVEFRSGAIAHLRFVDGDRPVNLEDWGWFGYGVDPAVFLAVRHEDPSAEVFLLPRRYSSYEIVASLLGRLSIDVTPPAGYLPVPTIELDVDLGPPREVVVELERIPSLR